MVLRLLSPFVYTFFSFITLVSSHSPHNPPTHSKGCTKPLPAGLSPGGPSVNFTVFSPEGGGERRYLVHLPEGFSRENDRPAPVVMAFHGFGQPTASMEEITGLSEDGLKIAGRDVVAVYPEGVNVGSMLSFLQIYVTLRVWKILLIFSLIIFSLSKT